MQRYFGRVIDDSAVLHDEDVFHLTKVMRARSGENIEVVADNKVFLCTITSLKPLKTRIIKELKEDNELKCEVILVVSLLKGEKMDLVIQKATELGVSEIVLLQSERSIAKIRKEDKDSKLQRFSKIAKEAAEQSKREKIPNISRLIDINSLDQIDADVKMIAYECASGKTSSFYSELAKVRKGNKVAILIGPEGGFSEKEVKTAINCGFSTISLGKRILRAETACIYGLSVISCYLERR